MTWSQLRTILWLRWRLTRNQWSRHGTVTAMISVIVTTLLVATGAAGGIGGFLLAASGKVGAAPLAMLGLWDVLIGAFLLFWLIGVLSEIQRSEAIDIGKILHMPVSLKGIFLVNYAASHLTLSIIVFVPWMVGLTAGFIWSRGWMMALMLPLVLGFLFSVTAWTYWLRGWLVALLVRNPRRYRAIVAGITMVFMLLSQLPNLLTNARFGHSRRSHERTGRCDIPHARCPPTPPGPACPPVVLLLHKVIPPLWVGNGAMSLAAGSPLPAVLGMAGTFALGALGLGGAYRSTRRFYVGRGDVVRTKRKRGSRVRITHHSTVTNAVRGTHPTGTELARNSRRGGGPGPGHVSLAHAGDGSEDGARLDHTDGPAVRRDDVLLRPRRVRRPRSSCSMPPGSRCCPFSA